MLADYDETDPESMWEAIHDGLQQSIDAARKLMKLVREKDSRLAGRIDGYLIGSLNNFMNNENQPGSLHDIEETLQHIDFSDAYFKRIDTQS